MIRDRVNIFFNSIKDTEIEEVDELLEDLIISAGEYVNSVISLEAGIVCRRVKKASDEYREYILQLHGKKDQCHQSFVRNLKVINRFFKNFNFPLLFDGDDENKLEVEKFALKLVSEFACSNESDLVTFK